MELWVVWLILAGIMVVVEMLTLTFYLLWLGIGAVFAAVIDLFFPGALVLEVVIGCVVVLILTVFTKPITRRFHASHDYKDVMDELVGKQGIVLEAVAADAPGIVKVGNETWSATSGVPLVKGESIIVVSRGNAVLLVEKWGG
ncbi:NfeD family protein [Paenibacillus alkaliterrae]|uniref:NfeD family protein n=1 Tax=Paenibacillus alkaliterrae TaxID=320909 RepID=UPI001F29EFF4|nr:NfeD family protein [Paenibacillus alkaliterrae]MCF2937803.1 NfeD family protein [Paenibacillus alkaliterrae]